VGECLFGGALRVDVECRVDAQALRRDHFPAEAVDELARHGLFEPRPGACRLGRPLHRRLGELQRIAALEGAGAGHGVEDDAAAATVASAASFPGASASFSASSRSGGPATTIWSRTMRRGSTTRSRFARGS